MCARELLRVVYCRPNLYLTVTSQFGYTGWSPKRHQHLHALLSRVAEKNQHNRIYVMTKHQRICVGIFGLKLFCSSRDTYKIALQAIKQFLQAVHHLRCRSYAGYAKTSQ